MLASSASCIYGSSLKALPPRVCSTLRTAQACSSLQMCQLVATAPSRYEAALCKSYDGLPKKSQQSFHVISKEIACSPNTTIQMNSIRLQTWYMHVAKLWADFWTRIAWLSNGATILSNLRSGEHSAPLNRSCQALAQSLQVAELLQHLGIV